MKLLTQEIRRSLPPLYATEDLTHNEVVVRVKFFTPDAGWTWYATEFDGEDVFFGLECDMAIGLSHFRLSDLQALRGPLGMSVERDLWFKPCPLNEVPEYQKWSGREDD